MIVAGIGCRRETSADEIERVVRLALGVFQLPAERLDAIATESAKADDPAFPEAARRLSVTLMACTISRSGVPSAAALRAARAARSGSASMPIAFNEG